MGKNPDLETEEGVCWEKSTEAHGFQAHKQDTAQTGTRKWARAQATAAPAGI